MEIDQTWGGTARGFATARRIRAIAMRCRKIVNLPDAPTVGVLGQWASVVCPGVVLRVAQGVLSVAVLAATGPEHPG